MASNWFRNASATYSNLAKIRVKAVSNGTYGTELKRNEYNSYIRFENTYDPSLDPEGSGQQLLVSWRNSLVYYDAIPMDVT